jgi:DNA-binding transcriptional ArsR family regulator
MTQPATSIRFIDPASDPHAELLNRAFAALSDPVRRAILERLGEDSFLVSELAAPFDISLQAISKHIQVLVRAGLIQQERTGRISKCSLDVGPMFAASVWINRYSKYWQQQFDSLAEWLQRLEAPASKKSRRSATPQNATKNRGRKPI